MKKFLPLLLIAIILNSQLVFAAIADPTFSDLDESHPQHDYIMWLYDKSIVQGYSDGTFQPDNCVNRAEFLKMLYTNLEKETSTSVTNPFSDLISDAWYYPYVISAFQDGIIQGYPDGTFQPDQCVTKPEVLKMTVEAYTPGISDTFPTTGPELMYEVTQDVWFYKYFAYALPKGLLVYDAEFSDYYPIGVQGSTRGDVAETLWRFDNPTELNLDSVDISEQETVRYEGEDPVLNFSYPSSWYILEDFYYETAAGVIADFATVELQTPELELITINGRMITCGNGEFDAYCLEHESGLVISSFDKSPEVKAGMMIIKNSMTTN